MNFAFDADEFAREAGGQYICPALGSSCDIAIEDGRLVLKHRRYDTINLYCVDQDRFFCGWGFLAFNRNADGAVTGFDLTDELFAWREMAFTRLGR
ncbi:MAG: hypothetical protein KJ970_02570 [Candidatus Eisenbacteria bacterium]|uniref:Uncharacterized protein n=1 Tax=Eiseniibacteriota bacterium TaxID=2212470 RepID=A0A948WBA2_UNCEI|nr:hypothetical protein [Candidatus Eisenbacteria bacterium]MBU1948120.1 hypothetical protein [Candidatus Eisenbacteria bacterium]MBU2689783.1 hypothetical protein [Candidatus Eisenbacteria bacterium]